jgi:hypothetical protein
MTMLEERTIRASGYERSKPEMNGFGNFQEVVDVESSIMAESLLIMEGESSSQSLRETSSVAG